MICDGADSNRQFINIHFPNSNPRDLHFTGYNMLTEDPMIFIMDCKVFYKVYIFTFNSYIPQKLTGKFQKNGLDLMKDHMII